MKNKIYLFLFLLINTSMVFAQYAEHFNEFNNSQNNAIGLTGEFSIASNGITNGFLKAYYRNEYIDTKLKDQVSSRLDANKLNRLGADANTGFYFEHFGDSLFGRKGGYWFSGGNYTHLDANFSKDAFDLFMRGNKMFAGDTANLDKFSLHYIQYRQIQAGWVEKAASGKGMITYGIGVSFIQGVKNLSAESNHHSGFYTAANGENIYTNLSINAKQSDTNSTKTFDFTGMGASTDFFFSYSEPENKTFIFEVSGLGKVKWNKNSLSSKIDTSLFFEGVKVKNIFKIDSTDYAGYDSTYFKKFVSFNNGTYETWLPALFHLSFEKTLLPHQLKITSGIRYRLMAGYSAQIYSSMTYSIFHAWNVSASVSYGGYTTWAGGFNTNFTFLKGTQISVGTNYVSLLLQPHTGTNMGAFASLRKTF